MDGIRLRGARSAPARARAQSFDVAGARRRAQPEPRHRGDGGGADGVRRFARTDGALFASAAGRRRALPHPMQPDRAVHTAVVGEATDRMRNAAVK